MFHLLNATHAVFALLVEKPQMLFSPMVTAGLTVVCIVAVFIALSGERRRD
jgi:ribosomal protein L13